jgi:hypothetical protein
MKCPKNLSFEDCELQILRQSIDKLENIKGFDLVKNPDIQIIISIVEKFLRDNKLICYGGTAINNILPEDKQFYNKNTEIPDYDFFSPNALDDAKKLADIYYKSGFREVEAKSGIHHGTYKVFVNFIPVADITYMPNSLFKRLMNKSIIKNRIYYSPPNYLRMSMYLELSRPKGDISRWEKVTKRLQLLNKEYPIKNDSIECKKTNNGLTNGINNKIQNTIKIIALDNNLVFFGGLSLNKLGYISHQPIYLLCDSIDKHSILIKESLENEKIKNVTIKRHNNIGEIIPKHNEIVVNKKIVVILFEPLGCHNYNIIENTKMRIATIDTMLSFYLAFLYSGRDYFDNNSIICLTDYLYKKQIKNIRNNKGLYKRYTLDCYGVQETIETMRAKKAEMYKKIKKRSKEFNEWFLRYIPHQEEYKKNFLNKKNLNKKNKKTKKSSRIIKATKTRKITKTKQSKK